VTIVRTPIQIDEPSPATVFLGIDPGLDGALGVLAGSTRRALVIDVPVANATIRTRMRSGRVRVKRRRDYVLAEIMRVLRPYAGEGSFACIEHVGPRPHQGVTSMFRMGYGVGVWEMALAASNIPFTRVAPTKWKNVVMEGGALGGDKQASILRASRLFPHIDLARKKDHNRAEALLIALYCQHYVRGTYVAPASARRGLARPDERERNTTR